MAKGFNTQSPSKIDVRKEDGVFRKLERNWQICNQKFDDVSDCIIYRFCYILTNIEIYIIIISIIDIPKILSGQVWRLINMDYVYTIKVYFGL